MSRYNWRMYEGDKHLADASSEELPSIGAPIRLLKQGTTTIYRVVQVTPEAVHFETTRKLFGFLGLGRIPYWRIQLEQAPASRGRLQA